MSVTLALAGAPPNWENGRLHWADRYRGMKEWFDRVVIFGHNERVVSRWPKATAETRARVTVRCYRLQLMDDGGAAASIKPIVDGLQTHVRGKSVKVGGKRVAVSIAGASLIWTDDREHCELTPPGPEQVQVHHRKDEHTIVEVERL